MRTDHLRSLLADTLDPDPRSHPRPEEHLAAVLVPIVEDVEDQDPWVVFTRRTDELPRHAGEISFPGGLSDTGDAALRDTALRETEEELGLSPSEVDVLGALPPVHTFVSSILIVPFVGMLRPRPTFAPNADEIAEVLQYPLVRLVDAEREVELPRGDHVYRGFAYDMQDNTIWGATAFILHSLIEIVRKEQSVSDEETPRDAPSDATLRSILDEARTIAVVGLSSKPYRDSYGVAQYLQRHGYRIVPVNPNETEVLGEKAYPSLLDVPTEAPIDIVDVFRAAEATPSIAEQAVRSGARVLWLQEGIVNDEAGRIAEEGGLTVVMDLCIRTTRARLEEE